MLLSDCSFTVSDLINILYAKGGSTVSCAINMHCVT